MLPSSLSASELSERRLLVRERQRRFAAELLIMGEKKEIRLLRDVSILNVLIFDPLESIATYSGDEEEENSLTMLSLHISERGLSAARSSMMWP